MIIIYNTSNELTHGQVNSYEVRINETYICDFEWLRTPYGLADCLRAAADAVEKADRERFQSIMELLEGMKKGA